MVKWNWKASTATGAPRGGAFASTAVERGTPIAEAVKGAKVKAN